LLCVLAYMTMHCEWAYKHTPIHHEHSRIFLLVIVFCGSAVWRTWKRPGSKSRFKLDEYILTARWLLLFYNWNESSNSSSSSIIRQSINQWNDVRQTPDHVSADHALFQMVRYVLLRPLRTKLDGQDTSSSSRWTSHITLQYFFVSIRLFIYSAKTCLHGKTSPRLGHLNKRWARVYATILRESSWCWKHSKHNILNLCSFVHT
jgi:hypothetical protein